MSVVEYLSVLAAYDRAVRAKVGALPAPVQRLSDSTIAKLFAPQAWDALVGDHLWVEPAPCGPKVNKAPDLNVVASDSVADAPVDEGSSAPVDQPL